MPSKPEAGAAIPAAFVEAARELHAAHLSIIHQLGLQDVHDTVDAYTTLTVSQYHEPAASQLLAYSRQVEERARELAVQTQKGIYGQAIVRLGASLRRVAAPEILSEELWERLRSPFSFDDIELISLRVDPGTRRGTASPVVTTEALWRRLDGDVGPAVWSVHFTRDTGGVVKATLSISGSVREGYGQNPDLTTACGEALRVAARLFGIGRGLHGEAIVAVELDESGSLGNVDQIREQMREAGVISD